MVKQPRATASLDGPESQRRLSAILEATSDLVSFADPQGRLLFLNDAGRRMLGIDEHEDISRLRIWDLVPPKGRAAQKKRLQRSLENGITATETHFVRQDGSEVPVSLVALTHHNQDGSVDFLSAIARDISEMRQAEVRLRQSEERLRALFDANFEGICIHNDGRVIDCNDAYALMLGYTVPEIIGIDVLDFLAPEFRELVLEKIRTDDKRPYECQARRKDGTTFEAEVLGRRQMYMGQPARVVAVRDISVRKAMERELQASEERLRLLVEHTPDYAIITLDAAGQIVTWNLGAERLTGYREREAVGQHVSIFFSQEDIAAGVAEDGLEQAEDHGYFANEGWRVRKDGSRFWANTVTTRLLDPQGQLIGYARLTHDLTARKQSEEAMERLAYHDSLTGLPNQLLLDHCFAQAITQARRARQLMAVLYVDLDHFKLINDALGHKGGDKLVSLVANRMQGALRESDTLARIGGDEFVVLLTPVSTADVAKEVAERIQEGLKVLPPVSGHQRSVTASIGIAMYPKDGTNQDTLIRNADLAMYQAKRLGRNTFRFYNSAVHPTILATMTLENELRNALERNELLLYYQPQFNVASGEIQGVEALLRWDHPIRGLLSADAFIHIAEESGLIVPIDKWVLREASKQNRDWQASGLPPIRMAVNVSPAQLGRPELANEVRDVLQEVGLDPSHLRVEITEQLAIGDIDETVKILKKLKGLGIEISLDDFGKGYSSLNYLRRLPIDEIKIDSSFIHNVLVEPHDALILSAIISLARSLNLRIVAEGVEIETQAAFLEAQECYGMQGNLFSEPLSAAAFGKLLRKNGGRLKDSLHSLITSS